MNQLHVLTKLNTKTSRTTNLSHLVDIASTKNLVDISKLLGLICRKISSKNTVLTTSSPRKLASCTWRGCTLLPTTLLHLQTLPSTLHSLLLG
ncbi:unnamed protein product, partial [Vitis vinifera]|uniref:Uncharacterized protein n=1 Tax=Vitis vinifera TaxID=29760 RepID=D7U7B7_VITVI